ncbi:3-isopropylmalate dehydrogenase [Phytomonospora endophytica]|uniref:3-isopropylmalate dehydrogenase n=1 Tax=Phytomonospora endophytica TaxID=714109 RepID=A0A841FLE0_9ACTN|nr:3-isopropylmalate dehydrogenase [Phytomonospora endophytica]MBB6034618.1 3-isopropylmalate dehydrogenase [Phytomonospora endophytica]GIG71322.1 3-isopropylmalate dehydrogenase [Phytomonospora endophytica]
MTAIAVIPGDGIGTEVVAQARKVLDVALPGYTATEYDLGARRYHATGEILPESVVTELDGHDAILLGAIGDPSVPPGVLERGLLLKLRFDFDQYVNLRPSRLWPGTVSPLADVKPGEIDLVVVREGTEGLYAGAGGTLHEGSSAEIATEESLNTRYGTERVIRDAFERARRRDRKHVTCVHKTNVLTHAGGLWRRTFADVSADYPDVATDYQHVDAAAMFLVTRPQAYDVIVTDNLFGDILTDIAAAVTGGIGLAASGNVNPDRTHPSMFEPVHGSAPDIAGKGVADPVAAIMSAGLLLEHLGHGEAATAVTRAVAADLAERTPGERLGTDAIGDRVTARVAEILG